MKKLLIIAAFTGILSGCGGNSQKMKPDTEMQNELTVSTIHNARIALDFEGTYVGKLPTASGMGMIVTITLGRDTYIKKMEYSGKEGVIEKRGEYAWNEAGNSIILSGITDAPNKYFVAENRLIQLDMDGNRITGESADFYVLHKLGRGQ